MKDFYSLHYNSIQCVELARAIQNEELTESSGDASVVKSTSCTFDYLSSVSKPSSGDLQLTIIPVPGIQLSLLALTSIFTHLHKPTCNTHTYTQLK